MTTLQMAEALRDVEAGDRIEDMRVKFAGVAIRGLREGVVPDDSPLHTADVRTFAATNSGMPGTNVEIALALAATPEDGQISLRGLAALQPAAEHNPGYIRTAIQDSVRAIDEGVHRVVADPETLGLAPDLLANIGFHAIEDSSMVALAA